MSTDDHRYARPRRRRPRSTRAGRLAAAAAGACGLLIGGLLAFPGDAAAAERPAVGHPADDRAGSTIRARETPPLPRGTDAPVPPGVPGLDVSAYQATVDWAAAAAAGARFGYVKATEGTGYQNPSFGGQFGGAAAAGVLRGAYHFALPDQSDGATQANFFVDHGGARPVKGDSLPPALDIEYNPYGDSCYDLNSAAMSAWIRDFTRTVHSRTGRQPAIYTSTRWWAMCTGGDPGFGRYPLWLPHYGSSVGDLPAGWTSQAIWQFADSGTFPGDQDVFNGSLDQLRRFARE